MLGYKSLLIKNSEHRNDFLYPDWEKLHDLVSEHCTESQYDIAFTELAKEWLIAMKACLPDEFRIYESGNFFLLCNEEMHISKNLIHSCERSLKIILEQFAGVLEDTGYGKHVLIVFKNAEQYNRYTDEFSMSGESPSSGGMCIHNGYTHIVLPHMFSEETPDDVIAHELTHALLTNYKIPVWLNEALAMRMEDIAAGFDGLNLNEEIYQKHVKFWNDTTIQDFWSGLLWHIDSIGFELSYDLARIIWKKIAVDLAATKEDIVDLISSVKLDDSGNDAIKRIFDYSLGELVGDFLGDGNWEPDANYFAENEKSQAESEAWTKDIEPLISIDEMTLLESSLSVLKFSPELEQTLIKQGVNTCLLYTSPSPRDRG